MKARTAPFAVGEVVGGKYRLDGVIGKGGMGTVYRAENLDVGRMVALKVLHVELAGNPDLITRFRREARAAAAIGHAGIVDVFDLARTDDGAELMVMELLRGESLATCITRRRRVPAREAVAIAVAVLDVLVAAHAAGIIHRDIKPDNVFVLAGGAIKVLDFGISKLVGDVDEVSITDTGAVIGTPRYMPPEQARGDRDIGPAADLYAVGALLYHAVSGHPPFDGKAYSQVVAQLMTERPRLLIARCPWLPPALDRKSVV